MARIRRSFSIKRLARALQGFSLQRKDPRLIINNNLLDVGPLLGQGPEAVEDAYDSNPLILLSLLEISRLASLFAGELLEEQRFLQLFSRRPPTSTFLHFLHPEPELEHYGTSGLYTSQAEEPSEIVSFLQNVLRYADIFFLSEPRDLFSLTSLLRSHLLAAVVVNADPDEFDLHLVRALHHLNIPLFSKVELGAYYNYIPVSSLDDLFDKLRRLRPTLGTHRLPETAPESVRSAGIPERHEFGGTYLSFYCVRAMGGVDGVEVRGKPEKDVGLIVDLGDADVDMTLTDYVEDELRSLFRRHPWLRFEPEEFFKFTMRGPERPPEDLGREVYTRLKERFSLQQVSVKFIFDALRLQTLKATIAAYQEERRQALLKRSDFDAPFFACTYCQRHSRNGFCLISVNHPPQCELSYDAVRATALFTDSTEAFSIKKGELLDRTRMRFTGIDKFARILSQGRIREIGLQSLSDCPAPVTAYAQNLAYINQELGGIFIISSDYDGYTPDQKTYWGLLRQVVGRQVRGVLGVSDAHLRSREFLTGDGGINRVVWMPSALKKRAGLQKVLHIATERECSNLMSLKSFLRERGFRF